MTQLSAGQLAGLVKTNIGGAGPASADILKKPDTDGPIFVAIALAESTGETTKTHKNANGTTDYGLWQINSVHATLLKQYPRWQDPTQNLAMAANLYSGRGGKFTDWTTFNGGAYAVYLPAAQRAWGAPTSDTSAADPTAAEQNASSENPLTTISNFLGTLTSASTWLRIGMGVAGVLILIIVIAGMMKNKIPLPGPLGMAVKAARASKVAAPVVEGVAA